MTFISFFHFYMMEVLSVQHVNAVPMKSRRGY